MAGLRAAADPCIINVDTMRARIQKWGNSLALRIPRSVAEETGLAQGAEVELQVRSGRLEIRVKPAKTYRPEDLIRRIRKSNLHGEVDFGPPVGRELL
jgi:antitoxin MazE